MSERINIDEERLRELIEAEYMLDAMESAGFFSTGDYDDVRHEEHETLDAHIENELESIRSQT